MAGENGHTTTQDAARLSLAVRIDRLATAVDELTARVEQQDDALADRLGGSTRRLEQLAGRVLRESADADQLLDQRVQRVADSLRTRIDDSLGQLREELELGTARGDEALERRGGRIERAVERVDSVLPQLRELVARVDATAAGLQVTSTAVAAYAEEALTAAEPLAPTIDDHLARLRIRIEELDGRRGEAITGDLAGAAASVDQLRERLHGDVDEVRDLLQVTVEQRLGEVDASVRALSGDLRASTDERLGAISQQIDALRTELSTTVEATLAEATASVARLEETLDERVEDAIRRGVADAVAGLRSSLGDIQGQLATDASVLPERIESALGPAVATAGATLSSQVDDVRDEVAVLSSSQRELLSQLRDEITGHLDEQRSGAADRQQRHDDALADYRGELEEHREELRALAARLVAQVEDAADAQASRLGHIVVDPAAADAGSTPGARGPAPAPGAGRLVARHHGDGLAD